MKTSVIAHRSLLRGTLITVTTLTALSLLAFLMPARADAGTRVVAQVGPVSVDYRDRGPGYDAQARVYLEPVATRVVVRRPLCGPDRAGCLVRVLEPCGRHDRDRDGRCDKCERRERRHDERHACGDDGRGYAAYDEIGGRWDRAGYCEHTGRCDACAIIEIGGCRDHRGMVWVTGHYETVRVGHGRGHGHGRQVWVPAHWEQLAVACR